MAMTTKSQWVKDLLGNKTFAWSHVKTVFYNRAKNILLKDKLDQIDAAISKQNSDKLNKIDLAKLFNDTGYLDVAEFNITQVQFNALTENLYVFNPESLNGPGGYGVVIPIATGMWRFWLGITTSEHMILKTNINNSSWSTWKWFSGQ